LPNIVKIETLLAASLDQFGNSPFMILNPCGSGGGCFNRDMPFAEIVISEIERDCGFEILEFL